MTDVELLKQQSLSMIRDITNIEMENEASVKNREMLIRKIEELTALIKEDKEALSISQHAVEILTSTGTKQAQDAYNYLSSQLNEALDRMFKNCKRKIRFYDSVRASQYSQLEILLDVGDGVTRTLDDDSGHGIAQIISILCIMTLIVITGSRRLLVLDEVIGGLSVNNLRVLTSIFWTFTQIGFQFIINEHGYIPSGAKVILLETQGDVSGVVKEYIEDSGVYYQGNKFNKGKEYSQDRIPSELDMFEAMDMDSVSEEVGDMADMAEPAHNIEEPVRGEAVSDDGIVDI